MKLYSTIKSDRATKGQGGNQWLDIDMLVELPNGDRITLANATVNRLPEGYRLVVTVDGATIPSIDYTKSTKCHNDTSDKPCHCAYHDSDGNCTEIPS